VLAGVARRGQRPQAQPAQVYLVAVGQRGMREGAAPRRGRQHGRALVRGQLHGPGQEIGVQVRVGGERDRQAPPGRGPAQGAHVTGGVDGQRPPVAQVGQVGRVPQALIDQRDQVVTAVAHGPSRNGKSARQP